MLKALEVLLIQTEQGRCWLESEHAGEAWVSFVPCPLLPPLSQGSNQTPMGNLWMDAF